MLLRRAMLSFLESRRLRCTDGTIQNYQSQLQLLCEWLSSQRVTWLAQIECLLHALETERERAAIFLLLDTGMRLGELAALEVGDLDLAGCTARIRHGKGDKERRVCFIEKTAQALMVRLANRWALEGETALFTTSHGTRCAAGGLYKLVVKVGKRAGVKVSPHMLRHTFATEYLNRGGHLHVLQKLLGHTTLTMTLRYTDVALEQAQRDHRKFSPLAA